MKRTITKYEHNILEDTPDGLVIKHREGDEIIHVLSNGRKLVNYEMTFTDDEIKHLSDILFKFDTESVKRFTGVLEELCRARYRLSDCPPSDIVKDISDLLKACKKLEQKLDKVSTGKQQMISFDKINFSLKQDNYGSIVLEHHNKSELEWWSDTMMKAREARNKLLDFIDCFETRPSLIKNKAHRPKADSSGFVKEIANAYSLCFDCPATKYSTTFKEVVQFALEAVGAEKTKDPTRKINNALSPT
ncbi:MAG: hypothetical protein EG822_18080 [Deltaproteobacteria bacterium]|nr:hypothetical protein [Deltaproteobacteria bacterium]